MLVAGIDEAGRGPVIGPLVIAIVLGEESSLSSEYRDSKKINPKKRKTLAEEILGTLETHVRVISPAEINASMKKKISLNVTEAHAAAELINALSKPPSSVFIDSPYPKPEDYTRIISPLVKEKSIRIVSENYADGKYRIAGAASIVAKVARDEEIEKIKEDVGADFNSGYPSDAITRQFLTERMDDPEVRKHLRLEWKTLKKILNEKKQKSLSDFEKTKNP